MKKKLTYKVLLLLIITVCKTSAQQLPSFSQYLFNPYLTNPAYAGLSGYSTVDLATREQWLGFANSPKTNLLSFETRILRQSFVHKKASARRKIMRKNTTGRVGVGAQIFNDLNGIISRTGFQVTYAYHIKLNKTDHISFAVSGSMYQFSIPRDKIQLETTIDHLVDNVELNMWIPDANVGVLYTTKTFYGGISADQLTRAVIKLGNVVDNEYRLYRHYNVLAGYKYEIDKGKYLEPSILAKATDQLALQMDFSARYIFNDFWFGLSYRTEGVAVFNVGARVNKLSFGYAFDYSFGNLKGKFGTHELMISYKFGDSPSRLRWLNK